MGNQLEWLEHELRSNAVQALTDYMFPQDCAQFADATIVLGMSRVEMPAAKAAELYRSGMSGLLVLTGGWNVRLGATEAAAMKRCLDQQAIPGDSQLLDHESTNTFENLRNASQLLKNHGLTINTLNIVSIHYHARRAWLTAKKVFGCAVDLRTCCYPSQYYSRDSWHTTELGRLHVSAELQKIQSYFPDVCLAAQLGWLQAIQTFSTT